MTCRVRLWLRLRSGDGASLVGCVVELLRRSRSGPCRAGDVMDCSFGAETAGACCFGRGPAGHEFRIAAEQNVGAAAGHVGGDGDHALAAGLSDDLGFLLVELGVEHDVRTPFFFSISDEQFGFFDAGGADQDRLRPVAYSFEFRRQRRSTFPSRCGRQRRGSRAQHLVGRDDDDFEACRSFRIRRLRSPRCRSCRASFLYMRK